MKSPDGMSVSLVSSIVLPRDPELRRVFKHWDTLHGLSFAVRIPSRIESIPSC